MKENDIRRKDALDAYLALVSEDVRHFFDLKDFMRIDCPGCAGNELVSEFEKLGFNYVSCKNCRTLFANPRPHFQKLNDFYSNSKSTSFWVNEFFKPVAQSRRKMIFRPRAEYISGIIGDGDNRIVGDIGAGFGVFLDELRKILPHNQYIAIEPSDEMADICSKSDLKVIPTCLEEVNGMDGTFDLITSFELTEHLFDPFSFFKKCYSLLKHNGRLVITTLNGGGFDILLLWERSKSISPPHHLNFFNTESIKLLLERVGFSVLEVLTPGQLDWDIVEGMIKNESVDLGRFWNLLANTQAESCKEELQNWISKNNLSSHMRVLAKKT